MSLYVTYIARLFSSLIVTALRLNPPRLKKKSIGQKCLWKLNLSSGSTYPIVYSLRLIDERWYLRNLVVNGIN